MHSKCDVYVTKLVYSHAGSSADSSSGDHEFGDQIVVETLNSKNKNVNVVVMLWGKRLLKSTGFIIWRAGRSVQ